MMVGEDDASPAQRVKIRHHVRGHIIGPKPVETSRDACSRLGVGRPGTVQDQKDDCRCAP